MGKFIPPKVEKLALHCVAEETDYLELDTRSGTGDLTLFMYEQEDDEGDLYQETHLYLNHERASTLRDWLVRHIPKTYQPIKPPPDADWDGQDLTLNCSAEENDYCSFSSRGKAGITTWVSELRALNGRVAGSYVTRDDAIRLRDWLNGYLRSTE